MFSYVYSLLSDPLIGLAGKYGSIHGESIMQWRSNTHSEMMIRDPGHLHVACQHNIMDWHNTSNSIPSPTADNTISTLHRNYLEGHCPNHHRGQYTELHKVHATPEHNSLGNVSVVLQAI